MDTDFSVEEINFQDYWLILKRRWKPAIGTLSLVSLAALVVAFSEKTVYQAEAKLLFRTDRSTSLTGLGEALGRLETLTFEANPLDTQVQVIQSQPTLATVIQDLDLRDSENNLLKPDDLAEDLTVEALAGTDVIKISYKSSDPEISALVSNKIAEFFVRENIQENRAEATAARDFVSQQLPQTEAALNQAEINLKQFKELNNIVSLDQESSSLVNISFNLQEQLDSAESQISNIDAIIQTYQAQLNISDPQYAVVIAALNQSEGVQKVLRELQEVEEEIATNRALFTEESQLISRLRVRQENLQSILQKRINQVVNQRPLPNTVNLQIGGLQSDLISQVVALNAQRQGLVNQVSALNNQLGRYESRMQSLPDLEKQQSELERNLQVAKATYESLLARFQELKVAESQNIGNVRLMSPALVPEKPVNSNKKLILLAGIVAGSLLGITVAFILDLLDASVKTVKEAKDLLGYATLGMIPMISESEEYLLYSRKERWVPSLVTRDLARSPISEAYRMLQANLKFVRSDDELKAIVVTSSIAQEGKSELAANLAVTMAQVGRKVLLVDANLRRPVQHRIWDIPNRCGLSNILVEPIDVYKATQEVMPNLQVLTSGVVPPNPVSLLDSNRMRALIPGLKKHYNFVIFDAPSLLDKADATVLSQLSDGILMVIRIGKTNKSCVKSSIEFCNQTGQNVLGVVINGISINKEPDSYFYYRDQPEVAMTSYKS
ncbi:polysaccharide biosynthesis tyrosine autokinase [Nodosilinea sp. P-1105]|uniref:GumC family protein n=1 Tax=Nodosilinea sp. P-1105 TaxID=2546229 RepID=UPI00146ABF11|nr:polysaccharide biosynthesis tyrosine autokinase [Nodosilinea sp. P-1105]NMF82937.1 polysaccharide biosynthesis tyrosine autokinase [Nodosilinea sp. P-1105]